MKRRYLGTTLAAAACAVLLFGCPFAKAPQVQLSNIEKTADTGAITVSAGVRAMDADGAVLDFEPADVQVSVTVRDAQGTLLEAPDVDVYDPADVTAPLSKAAPQGAMMDVVLVADNSGSETGNLETIKDACLGFIGSLILPDESAEADKNRVGIVRVSTCSTIMSELSSDEDLLNATVDDMFITNGWTALWDGIRLANEVLAAGTVSQKTPQERRWRAIFVFTDARENNSAGENPTDITCDDGIDTTFDDLLALEIDGVQTPIFTMGIGNNIDEDTLTELAEATGGFYRRLPTYRTLTQSLEEEAVLIDSLVPVEFQVKSAEAAQANVLVTVTSADGQIVTGDFVVDLTE